MEAYYLEIVNNNQEFVSINIRTVNMLGFDIRDKLCNKIQLIIRKVLKPTCNK